ncbi:FBP domain-containing protein [Galactobacter caseinivorans]|uniref:FBP domain-containing protein n=1 Tax=Galactobacter caseinivorans TaxID=2676123 RepID=A0A496PJX2_9MICC|nr:FBP domain-containing protein [Galactobacter caseinivorans]RKW70804.1 FBP domain-containing protein [Galactobacter caseinivorans]
MQSLTLAQIRASFVNTSRREATQATPPQDLSTVEWDSLELFGWSDPRSPQRAYVIIPTQHAKAKDGVVGIMLRAVPAPPRQAMCALCEDITQVSDVKMFSAKMAGSAGRNGDTLGTMIHADFSCSTHARRFPSRLEGQDDPQAFIAARTDRLREHAERFALRVLGV